MLCVSVFMYFWKLWWATQSKLAVVSLFPAEPGISINTMSQKPSICKLRGIVQKVLYRVNNILTKLDRPGHHTDTSLKLLYHFETGFWNLFWNLSVDIKDSFKNIAFPKKDAFLSFTKTIYMSTLEPLII